MESVTDDAGTIREPLRRESDDDVDDDDAMMDDLDALKLLRGCTWSKEGDEPTKDGAGAGEDVVGANDEVVEDVADLRVPPRNIATPGVWVGGTRPFT